MLGYCIYTPISTGDALYLYKIFHKIFGLITACISIRAFVLYLIAFSS